VPAMQETRHVPIDLNCIDAPDVPTIDGCQLTPGKGPAPVSSSFNIRL
jgi:hypothetical protein